MQTDPSNFETEPTWIDEFTFESHAFTQVDWSRVYEALMAEGGDVAGRLEEAKIQWSERLRRDLGGAARLYHAGNVLLVTDLEERQARACLGFADQVHGALRLSFSDLAHPHALGRVPILLFADDSDYFEYLSHFYPEEGTFPASCGVHLNAGLPHIAAYYEVYGTTSTTIVHELCHLMVSHLPLPLWVNEGVAMKLPRALAANTSQIPGSDPATTWWMALADTQAPLFPDDIFERHHQFWNEENIQHFWAGISFQEPGESEFLSYNLAEMLVTKLSEDWQSFLGFLATVHFADGGQTAALDHLGTCLGAAVEPLLGPGHWRPVRKAMVDAWNASKAHE